MMLSLCVISITLTICSSLTAGIMFKNLELYIGSVDFVSYIQLFQTAMLPLFFLVCSLISGSKIEKNN